MSENQSELSLDLGTSFIRDEKNPAVNHDLTQLEADFAEKFDPNHIETATLIEKDGTVISYEVY